MWILWFDGRLIDQVTGAVSSPTSAPQVHRGTPVKYSYTSIVNM